MQKLFSTDGLRAEDRYRKYLEFSDARFMPMVFTRTDERMFDAVAHGLTIGDLAITRTSLSALTLEADQHTIRHPLNKPDMLAFSIILSGECIVSQYDRTFLQSDGGIAIVDANRPFKFVNTQKADHFVVHIPRDRLESDLGPARNFAGISMKNSVAALIVKSFFRDFLRLHDEMQPDTLRRMASVGVDLITASLAECMAQAMPEPVRNNVFVQRAKHYIEANLSKIDLTPSEIAAATGVSLRQLQLLFSDHGQQIADWLWRRRLQVAAERLADPTYMHLPVGTLAYGCGFSSQAHFSRRFKDHFDMRPGDYRRRALVAQQS